MPNEIIYRPYQLNPLMRNVLITTAEVLFHAPTEHEVDPRKIQQSIINAEERFIVEALGYDFYANMATTKNRVVDSTNITQLQALFAGSGITLRAGQIVNSYLFLSSYDQQLWLDQLWKIIAECVLHTAIPTNWAQFGTQGIVHNNPTASPMNGGLTSADLKSIQFIMDKNLTDRIDPLMKGLQRYICKNKVQYPRYTQCLPETVIENTVGKKTDWVTGLYDNPKKGYCDWDNELPADDPRIAITTEAGQYIFTEPGNV